MGICAKTECLVRLRHGPSLLSVVDKTQSAERAALSFVLHLTSILSSRRGSVRNGQSSFSFEEKGGMRLSKVRPALTRGSTVLPLSWDGHRLL